MTGLLHEKSFSRKSFVKGGGALVIGFSAAGALVGNAKADQIVPPIADHPSEGTFQERGPQDYLPNLQSIDSWITLNADNTVTVTHGETELGHGTPTGILMIVAEEMNMNFDQMWYARPESWLNVTGGGSGSSGISSRSTQIRAAAAYANQVLLGMASTKLNTPVASLTVSGGVVSGAGVNQRDTYSALLHASKTRCFGASKTRRIRSSGLGPDDGGLLFSGMALLLFLHLVQEPVDQARKLAW